MTTGRKAREHLQLQRRCAAFDIQSQIVMATLLKNDGKEELHRRAEDICRKHPEAQKPDRLCTRHRPAMICWYVKHWPIVYLSIPNQVSQPCFVQLAQPPQPADDLFTKTLQHSHPSSDLPISDSPESAWEYDDEGMWS
jgi:hypothetical protein